MNEEYADREQTGIKHFALRTYLEAATRIIGSAWTGFSYVDCCAGPWESRSEDYSDTSFGISVAVLRQAEQWLRNQGKKPQFRALLIEEKAEPYKRLVEFAAGATSKSVLVEARNWDFREHTTEIVRFVASPSSFGFMFIDPTGWTLAQIGGARTIVASQAWRGSDQPYDFLYCAFCQ